MSYLEASTLEGLKFDEYQLQTATTAIYPESGTGSQTALAYVALGLAGEAGEIANKVKKILRDDAGEVSDEVRKVIAKEAGDVLWYLARLVDELGYPLEIVAESNLAKLKDRAARGVVGGSGDNR